MRSDSPAVRRALVGAALLTVILFLLLPLAIVLTEALRGGVLAFRAAVTSPDARAAIRLTVTAALLALPANLIFGLAAGWALGKFSFPGRSVLTTLVDLPFAVSPVVAGMLLVLLFGREGLLGPFLLSHGVKVIFAVPGIVLATTFVTFPFVARELIPAMQSSGIEEEEAARVLGAGCFRTFLTITLPNVKWALFYGVLLSTARAVGEFGAVSVVSGHIRGQTNTLPLHVEILYNEYEFQAAFACASLLTLLAVVTLTARQLVEVRERPTVAWEAP